MIPRRLTRRDSETFKPDAIAHRAILRAIERERNAAIRAAGAAWIANTPRAAPRCIDCDDEITGCLVRFGTTRCHDCRDATVKITL